MIISVCYHYVRPAFTQPHPGIFGITPEEFRRQLELLAKAGTFVSQADIRRYAAGEAGLPDRGWLVTFDDGLREHADHALPILDDMGIPAIFFVNTKPLEEEDFVLVHMTHLLRSNVSPATLERAVREVAGERGLALGDADPVRAARQYRYDAAEVAELKYLLNFVLPEESRDAVIRICFERLMDVDAAALSREFYMDRGQLRMLAERDMLGTHTHSHHALGRLPPEAVRTEIDRSVDLLAAWTGVRVDGLGYPYGSLEACPQFVGEVAREAGIRFAFTMERAAIDPASDAIFLPRCAPNDLPGGKQERWSIDGVFDEMPRSQWYVTQ